MSDHDFSTQDLEVMSRHEPATAVDMPDDPDPNDTESWSYPRSQCCNALMVNGGIQCQVCGSDGTIT